MKSQCEIILDHLYAGEKITPVDALNFGGGFRLSERIRELQKRGHIITKGWFVTENGARVRQYWINKRLLGIEL
jgi:hypothetical protein